MVGAQLSLGAQGDAFPGDEGPESAARGSLGRLLQTWGTAGAKAQRQESV